MQTNCKLIEVGQNGYNAAGIINDAKSKTMQVKLMTEDLQEIIVVHELPDEYRTVGGIKEYKLEGSYKGIEGQTSLMLLNGLAVNITHMHYPTALRTYLEKDSPHLEMHFELSGGGYAFTNQSTGGMDIAYANDHHALYYFPELKGFSQNPMMQKRTVFEVELSLEYLSKTLDNDLSILNEFGESIRKSEPAILGNQCFPITMAMKQVISEIVHCPYAGMLKKVFVEGKVLELFSLQIAQYIAWKNKTPKLQLRRHDIDKLHYVKNIVDANLSQPYSLLELSKLSGLNNFKLKEGFKELFDNTVYGYLSDVRLEKAKILLLEGNLTVAEISYQTGYKNPQHFTVAFKKKFGCLPKEFKGRKER